ncbi:hypothetical protein PybrP1_010359 [[Pythium] brassicae (nom. inval.)]|nr:hypothetical protein PybrP1_010359 [[Pythium] brassicae (nom. inval.)]
MSGWGLRLNPWGSSYSSLEAEQMRFVHKAFCEAMEVGEEDLPLQLKMDDSFYPLYRPTTADFDEHTFMRKMQDTVGLLRNPAEAIISSICAYQKERLDRSFSFSGYMNDPRTLLLEEFKDWAMRSLAPASCTTEATLLEVRRRHSYVLRLQHGQQGIFHSGSGERSLMGTLKDIRGVIESRVLPTIETERAHSSAREQLHTLEARGTDGLMHGVQFLFYVLRNTANTPADCTISNLQSQQHAGMKDAMQSKSGQMLQVLLNTPAFKELFPESATNDPLGSLESAVHPLLLTSEEQETMTKTAVFCNTEAKPIVPAVLAKTARPSATASDAVAITPKEFLSQSNSGVVALRTDAANEAYDIFTKLHGLLKLLADLLVSCRKARQLAGPGGDLLVYGPGGEAVRHLMQSLEAVQAEIGREVSKLTRIGVRELDRLKPNQEKAWRYSFSKVLPLENYLAHDFNACVEPIQRIHASADPAHVQKMYKQFKAATGMWVLENSSICNHVSAALGGPFIEDKPAQQQLEQDYGSGPQIELLDDDATATASSSNALVVANGNTKPAERKKAGPVRQTSAFAHDASNAENQPANQQQMVVSQNLKAQSADSSLSFLSTAATLVSWAVGAKKTVAERNAEEAGSPQHSDDDDDKGPLSSTSSTSSATSSTSPPSPGVLDVLLLVRQSVQRIGQLSWGIRTSFHTSAVDEGDFDAFIVLCSIYQGVGVPCASDLLLRLRQHRVRLSQLLRKHMGAMLTCVIVLQRRIVDEEKSIRGMALVYRRLDRLLTEFELEMDAAMSEFKHAMFDCAKMKAGILAMPLQQQQAKEAREFHSPAQLAYHSINALAANISGQSAPSAAILTHGEYMTQMGAQMELHWNSISHLLQSVKSTLELVASVADRVRECAKDPRNYVPPEQLDYIFEYNYDGFFRQATRDLEGLMVSIGAP